MSSTWPPGHGFWNDQFPVHTMNGAAPHLYKGIIPTAVADHDAVLDGFAQIRRALTTSVEITAHARIYLGEERRDDLLETVLSAPAWADGEFVPWMQRLTRTERFSLVINNLETVSPHLAAGLGAFLASLLDGWGVPMGGAELVAFAGNYSGTAFGVHEGYEDAFLVHFGPGVKDFYTWPQEEYRKRTGAADPLYGDYQWLLEHAERHILQPGDALFLPRRVFHVGRQDQFSVSVAVPLYTYPDATILRQAVLPDLLDTLLTGGPDSQLGAPSPMARLSDGNTPTGARLTRLATQTLTSAAKQAATAAHQHARQRWNTVLSNGGWELVTHDLARSEAAADFRPKEITPGALVSVVEPYRLITDSTTAFLRGFEITLGAPLDTTHVQALNTGADTPLTLPDDDSVLDAIRALGVTGGLRIIPSPGTRQEDLG